MMEVGSSDPSYEYNCPQFVDFSVPIKDDENAEAYFNFDHEQGKPVDLDEDEQVFRSPHSQRDSGINSTLGCSPTKSSKSETPAPSELPESMDSSEVKHSPPSASTQETASNQEPEVKKPGVLANLVTSLAAWRSRGTTVSAPSAAPIPAPVPAAASKPRRRSVRSPRSRNKRSQNARTNSTSRPARGPADSPAAKKQRQRYSHSPPKMMRNNTAAPLKRERSNTIGTPVRVAPRSDRSLSGGRRKRCRTLSKPGTPVTRSRTMSCERPASAAGMVESHSRRADSLDKHSSFRKPAMPAIKQKLTMPKTPACMKRTQKQTQFKSSEQLEMERIEHFKKQMASKRKMAAESHRSVKCSSSYQPIKSLQPPTLPTDFQFATDKRVKGTEKKDDAGKNFVASLRDHSHSPERNTVHRGPTKPHPFHFAERKRKRTEDADKNKSHEFHSMAETVIAFSSKTPERFRTKRSGAGRDPSPAKKAKTSHPQKLTIPKTPNFHRLHQRAPAVKSQAQRDQEELEAIQSYKFRARPVNEDIFKKVGLGVRKVPRKELTRPEGFELEADRRVHVRQEHRQANKQDEQFEFKANPVPKDIFEKPIGVRPAKELPLTIPESPAFALKRRLRSHLKDIEPEIPEDEKKVIRAHPVPHTGIPFQPKTDHRATEIHPFSFDERDRHMLSQKELKIQKALKEETKIKPFRAQPIPPPSPDLLPSVPHRPITRPEPFELESDIRGQQKAEEWSHQMEEELRIQRLQANFRAQPNTVTNSDPFIPEKSMKPLTDVSEFQLNTERRAEKREEWETWKKTREVEEQAEIAAEERKRQEEDRKEIARLRQEMVHKPNPVRHYRTVDIHQSTKPLTEAHTPRFSERLRSKTVRY